MKDKVFQNTEVQTVFTKMLVTQLCSLGNHSWAQKEGSPDHEAEWTVGAKRWVSDPDRGVGWTRRRRG